MVSTLVFFALFLGLVQLTHCSTQFYLEGSESRREPVSFDDLPSDTVQQIVLFLDAHSQARLAHSSSLCRSNVLFSLKNRFSGSQSAMPTEMVLCMRECNFVYCWNQRRWKNAKFRGYSLLLLRNGKNTLISTESVSLRNRLCSALHFSEEMPGGVHFNIADPIRLDQFLIPVNC